jgi:hypothetical protein
MLELDATEITYKPTRKQVARLAALAEKVEDRWDSVRDVWTLVPIAVPSRPWDGMIYASLAGWRSDGGGGQDEQVYEWLIDDEGNIVAATVPVD